MKKILLSIVIATLISSCKKECSTYHVEDGKECIAWSARFAGTWIPTDQPTCSNSQNFAPQVILYKGDADNLVKIDNQLSLTATSATLAEGGPWTLGDNNGTWTVKVTCQYIPSTREAVYNGLGAVTGYNTTDEHIVYSTLRNEGTPTQVSCSGTYYK
jgi:hypothetical protein